ncbi:beta-hexosaminidase [Vibrio halioticoli NBRC 102217]|uniref:Beta-hexosaminidase n=1 Tax=Vibrio halioticoli NBRC 102217 TaxID=1219072 RepID=V5HLV3_9VIBR|nr:beta-N-acetylhexosaminidase [Vibrio halioticoli]GAD90180.1 beta-hexosaminidase [Vibrio halioticoli NBRC 102217]
MGPLWLDVKSYEIDAEEREILQHPTVGGVILFTRNYHDNQQLQALTDSIRAAAKRPILIGVDQEGGRVQRFKEGFTRIPAAQSFASKANGDELAKQAGWLMAAEVMAHGIDLSFAPVLDQGHQCLAIGSRAFGEDKATILKHSSAFMLGMKQAGMATTGKHFPGHGGVIADSHKETPIDGRSTIFDTDMAIFRAQIEAGLLDAMMPAHVVYPEYDDKPASGSQYWLKNVLREQLAFKGLVFSDDLNMEGAGIMGGPVEKAMQSLRAGCDMVLMCNNRNSAVEIIDTLPITQVLNATQLVKKNSFSLDELHSSREWKEATEALAKAELLL